MQRKAGGVNKKLGIQPSHVLNSLFPMPGQSLAADVTGQLARPEFIGFWAAVSQTLPPDENPMIRPLLEQLQGRLGLMYAPKLDDPKLKKKDKNYMSDTELLQMLEGRSYININTIVTTLAFLLFSPFKFDPNGLARWFVSFQRSDYAMSVPDCVKNLAIFIKYRCMLENVGWDDSEHRFQDPEKKILTINFETMKTLGRDSVTGAAGAIELNGDIFTPLIIAATKIIQTQWIPMLSLDESDIGANESGFIHTYLLDIVSQMGKDYQTALISSLFARAQLISQGGAQPAIREQTFLAIVHMSRCFLTQGAVVNVTLLRRALLVLQNFYLWQQPFGRVAESLITLIQYELLAPGYSFRTFIQRECNVVDYTNSTPDTVPSFSSFAYTTRLESELTPFTIPHNGYTQNKPIFYLYDTADRRSSSVLTIIDPIEFNPDKSVPVTPSPNAPMVVDDYVNIVFPPHPVMLLSILNGLSIDAKIATDEVFNIKYMTFDQLKPWYARLVTLHHKLAQGTVAPTVAVRRKEVEEFKTEFVQAANGAAAEHQKNGRGPAISTLPTSPETHHRFSPRPPNVEHVHVGIDAPAGLAGHPGFPAPSAYDKMLEIFHSFVPPSFLNSAAYSQHRAAMQLSTSSVSHHVALHTSGNAREDSESSVSRVVEDNFISRIRQSSMAGGIPSVNQKSDIDPTSISHNFGVPINTLVDPPSAIKRTVRFAVVGNAKHLGRVVTAYQKIILNYPQFFDYLDVKFMIIPTGENWLGNYLARNDLWYFRHIFAPFSSPATLIPWIRDDEARLTPQTSSIGQSYPSQFFRACTMQYAQQAHYNLPITIYKVEASTDARATEVAATIYFIQRLELGTGVAVEEYRNNNAGNQSAAGMTFEQIQQQKGFIQPQLEMSIGYSKCDLMGVSQQEIFEEQVQFQALTLSNIPTKVASGSTQTTAQADDDKSKKKGSKDEKPVITTELLSANQNDLTATPDPINNTLEAFIFSPRVDKAKIRAGSFLSDPKQHLADVHCSSNTAFRVRIDGTLYGPFKYIHVSPCTTTLGQIAKFNVQTFFPVGQTHNLQ